MTSPEARRNPINDGTVRTMGDAGRVAKDRLESALFQRRAGTPDGAIADALTSCAASLMRLSGQPVVHLGVDTALEANVDAIHGAQLERQVAGLIAELHVLRDTVRNLHDRLDVLEDRP